MRITKRIIIAMFLLCLCAATKAKSEWIDVTGRYLKNPQFNNGDRSDWTLTGQSSAFGAISFSCMEMWNGYMRLEHQATNVPNGHYRISVQAFYRTCDHETAYHRYVDGTETISGYLFANDVRQALCSEYIFHFNANVGRTYTPDGLIFFPNSMETAQMAFSQGAYQNAMEFDVTDGSMRFGLYNDPDLARGDNWMIFDSFRIEYLAEIVEPQPGSICLNEVMAANVDVKMSPAHNFNGWIELYNPTEAAVTLGGCFLSDDPKNPRKWQLPHAYPSLSAHGHQIIWMGSNNINTAQAPFSLDCEGGALVMSNQSGDVIFTEVYPEAIGRASLARTTDGGSVWSWTALPTPGRDNSLTQYADGRVAPPTVGPQGGFFTQRFSLSLSCPSGTTLRYTTDGTTPTMANGLTWDGRDIVVSESSSFRFRLFQDGKLPSEVVTRTFVKHDYDHTLPVIMVSTDPRFLYDDSIGVYVRGVNGCTGNGQSSPVNWNMDWDRPVNFHYVLPQTGEVVVNQDVDFCISGGWTRSGDIKSFKLKADRVYENRNAFDYPFFAAKPYIKNKTLQVRYGGNDGFCRIKDAALHEIIQRSGVDLDVMSYQPAVHYLNGEYKGLINIREPNNKDFAYANWGLSKNELEVYEQSPDSGAYMMLGKHDVLDRLYELSKESTTSAAYDEILSLLDIDEYVNYMAAELFLSSWDWPDNNLKAYRKTNGGRYRITFFDLDAAFGTEGREYDEEHEVYMGGNPLRWIEGMQWHRYDYIYDTAEQRYGEIKFCTFFLNMLRNDAFRRRFVDALSLMGGSVFEPNRAQAILDELGNRVRVTMSWEHASPDGSLNEIRNALKGRAVRMAGYMKDYEPLRLASSSSCRLALSSNISRAPLYLNNQQIPYGTFDGVVFLPSTIRTEVPAGYRFLGWAPTDDPASVRSSDLSYPLPAGQTEIRLCAIYEPVETATPVVINEVGAANDIFLNDYFKRNDWVELYNTTADTIDVEGMFLSDDLNNPTKYEISKGSATTTKIAPHGHLIVWCDKLEPRSQLHASFKLDSDEGVVSISALDQSWIDHLDYGAHDFDQTVGRYPDGTSAVYLMNIPTIGRPNLYTSYVTPVTQKSVTGITEPQALQQLALRYAAGHLIVSGMGDERVHLAIYTPAARQVSSTDINLGGGRAEVDCSHLAPGCYIAKVRNAQGQTASCKFVLMQ